MTTPRARAASANLAFSALLYSIFALAMITGWNLQAGAGLLRHAVTAAFALPIVAVALRRCRLERLDLAVMEGTAKSRIGRYLTLAATGSVLALPALAGSAALFAMGAFFLNWTPWSRMGLRRDKLLPSCASVGGGGACVMLASRLPRDPFVLPLLAWVLWVIACLTLLYLAFGNGARARAAGRQEDGVARHDMVPQRLDTE